jgi:hypothetical protein
MLHQVLAEIVGRARDGAMGFDLDVAWAVEDLGTKQIEYHTL